MSGRPFKSKSKPYRSVGNGGFFDSNSSGNGSNSSNGGNNSSNSSRRGRLKRSKGGGGSNSSAFRSEYEYFQLYSPDDSDLEAEDDPDVRSLLTGGPASCRAAAATRAAASGRRISRGAGARSTWGCWCCCRCGCCQESHIPKDEKSSHLRFFCNIGFNDSRRSETVNYVHTIFSG